MNIKTTIITVISISLFIFLGVGNAIGTPNITSPNDGWITNQTSFLLEWDPVTNASCYRVYESYEGSEGDHDTPNTEYSVPRISTEDGSYTFKVKASSMACNNAWFQGNASDPVTVTIDTTSPTASLSSPSAGDDNVAVSSDVVIDFSDDNPLNQTYTKNNFTISPSVSGGLSWSGGKELTFNPDSDLEHGETYTVSVQPKDIAGNTGEENSWRFITSVRPKNVEIQNPSNGDSLIAGTQIDIQVSVTGRNETAVRGATVQTSGACSTTLTEQTSGTYAGTCTPSQTGEKTLTVTASNAGHTTESNTTLTIEQEKTLSINLIEPKEREYPRGTEIKFKAQPTVEGTAYENASITSPQLSFTEKENNTYTATFTPGYSETHRNIELKATGTVQGVSKTTEKTIELEFTPITLNTEMKYLVSGEETQSLQGGDDLKLQVNVEYPNGAPVTNAEIQGTTTHHLEGGVTETSQPNLLHQGTGEYVTEKKYTVSSHLKQLKTSLSVNDPYGNTWTGNRSIPGPIGGLKLHLTKPKEIEPPSPIEITATPGQNLLIEGHVVTGEHESASAKKVTINGEEMIKQGPTHTLNYKVPETTADTVELNIKIHQDSVTYPMKGTIYLQNPTATLPKELETQGITRGEKLTAQITYPNGEPLKNGSIHINIGEKNYTMKYNPEAGQWQTTEPINLGEKPKTVAITVKGKDQQENTVESDEKTGVKYSPSLSLIDRLKDPKIIGSIVAVLIAITIGLWYYFYRYKGKKKFQKKITELKDTFTELDNAYRSFSKTKDQDKLRSKEGDIKSKQRSIREEIIDLIQKHRSLEKQQLKTAEKIAEKQLKNLLTYFNESEAGRRAWLTGITSFEANKILSVVKDEYAEEIQKLEEQGKTHEEIEETLTQRHGFKKSNAKDMLKYAEKKQKRQKKIKEDLEKGKDPEKIKEKIKKGLDRGKDTFQEYRARKLLKEAGADIKLKEEQIRPQKPVETKKETREKGKKREMNQLKRMVKALERKGKTQEQIEKEIEKQGKKAGLTEEQINEIKRQIEE